MEDAPSGPCPRPNRNGAILGASVLLGACGGPQSALDPAGREAAETAALFWVMLAGAAFIWLAVITTAVFAGRTRSTPISARAGLRIILWAGAIVPTLVLAALLAHGLRLMPVLRAGEPTLRLQVSAEQFWWRVTYDIPHAPEKWVHFSDKSLRKQEEIYSVAGILTAAEYTKSGSSLRDPGFQNLAPHFGCSRGAHLRTGSGNCRNRAPRGLDTKPALIGPISDAVAQGAGVETANELRLPAGRTVEIVLDSVDVIHSFWIPALAGKLDMIPGRTTRLVLHPERPGTYRGVCAEFCGRSHALMAFPVIVMEPAAFDAWLAGEAAPTSAGPPPAPFLANGCGGCHAVRGTAATGRIGPDLTHLADRRTLGAGLLDNTPENRRRFIAQVERLKPGVRMPSYDMLPPADLDAIAAYLGSLR